VTAAANLPPGPRWPVPVQGLAYVASRRRMMQVLSKRYGSEFTVRLPFFGPTVIISDPALVKQFFQTRTDVLRNVDSAIGR
jgi:cytochrome P450 family 138